MARPAWAALIAAGASLALALPPAAGAQSGAATDPADLTAAQLAGQRAIYSFSGTSAPSSLLTRIRQGRAAGVIFFSSNVASRSQVNRVAAALTAAQRASSISEPLLLMTDQEGGEVRRLPGAPTMSARQVGRSSNSSNVAAASGRTAARNITSYGLNVNLAPVLGVYRQNGDFLDQFQRSYSSNASVVARLGRQFIVNQQRDDVAATAKHFPGLGAARSRQNTDERPVTIRLPLSTLRTIDERPFRSAISARVDFVMPSWAIYPALDARRPAGLSAKWITGELRNRLGYRGVVVTDAIEAGALARFGGVGNRSVLAAAAGADLMLYSGGRVSEGDQGGAGMSRELGSGRLSRASFEQAVSRILELRRSLGD